MAPNYPQILIPASLLGFPWLPLGQLTLKAQLGLELLQEAFPSSALLRDLFLLHTYLSHFCGSLFLFRLQLRHPSPTRPQQLLRSFPQPLLLSFPPLVLPGLHLSPSNL